MAHENKWGAGKIQGELLKLGYRVGKTTILNVLKQKNIPPQPERTQIKFVAYILESLQRLHAGV